MCLAAMMFTIGVVGVVIRRNSIVVFMCIELMLNSVNLSFVALSRSVQNLDGQVAVFFVMVVAAAEAAVGLAIIISVFRNIKSVETTDSAELSA
jgi:NADH-quinone oxidoreductase subunit K